MNNGLIRSIDSGSKGPHVLISAGVHGDELEPILAALELRTIIGEQLSCGKVTIVPVVNESAFSNDSRYGVDGLDLARICPGNRSGSESEQAAAFISDIIRGSDYYIDMHTGGRRFKLLPLAGYMLHASAEILEKQRNMAEAFGLPIVWGTDSKPNGRTLSVARDANIPAIYVEYGGGTQVSKEIVDAYVKGCLNVLASLDMVQHPSQGSADNQVYWLEDDCRDSGHLQSKLPSPESGIFISNVKLGDQVEAGHLWGWIVDMDTNVKHAVKCMENGLVFFLNVSARVEKGESLGGILPVSGQDKKIIINESER